MTEIGPDRIRTEIEKTGFPLELRSAAFLQETGFLVATNLYYTDKDEGKGREMDIRALRNVRTGPVWQRYCMFIECKKADKPWVFLSSEANPYDQEPAEIWAEGAVKNSQYSPPQLELGPEALRIAAAEHPFFSSARVARAYFEAFKDSSRSDGESRIFGALVSVVKATLDAREAKFAGGEKSLCFYYPVVVVEGRLFEGHLKHGKVEVSEATSVVVSFFYSSASYGSQTTRVLVVAESAFRQAVIALDECHKKMDAVIPNSAVTGSERK